MRTRAAESALFGEPGMPAPSSGWQRSMVKALFADEAQATSAAALLLAQDWAEGDSSCKRSRPVPEQDWVRLTQSQFAPVPVTADFWIVPSWHEPPAQARRVIRLDPGLAFGTGTHPTTRMCLRWTALQAPAKAAGWTRVLDYGCGSGILAIGAALHGAQRHRRGRHRPRGRRVDDRQRASQRRVASRRLARRSERRLPTRVRQHPGHAAQAAGPAAVFARRAGW